MAFQLCKLLRLAWHAACLHTCTARPPLSCVMHRETCMPRPPAGTQRGVDASCCGVPTSGALPPAPPSPLPCPLHRALHLCTRCRLRRR